MTTANKRPPVNYAIFYSTFPLRLNFSWGSNHLIIVRLHCTEFRTSSVFSLANTYTLQSDMHIHVANTWKCINI